MSEIDQNQEIEPVQKLNMKFQEIVTKIENYLQRPAPDTIPEIKMQEENDRRDIPDIGRNFGTHFDEKNNYLILANWLTNLLKREQKGIEEFLLVRECFRLFLHDLIPLNHPFTRLTEIVLQNIAMLWLIEEYNYSILSSPIIYIRGRAEGYEEEGILMSEHWVYFLINCNKYNITALEVFNILVTQITEALEKERDLEEVGWVLIRWLKAKMPSTDSSGLPLFIEKQRNFEVVKALASVDYKESSAKKIGEMINRSHNVVNIGFKELHENYNFYWWPSINLLKLRLYPYFFRLTISGIDNKKLIAKKILENKYIRFLREKINEKDDEVILVGYLQCPLYSQQKLAHYFERVEKKGYLKDFFIQQIRNKMISYSVSKNKIEQTRTNYQKLFCETDKEKFCNITLNKEYDITDLSDIKKEVFAEDILIFISTLMARFPGKAHYSFKPIEIIYELLAKNDIDTTDIAASMYYISQMEIRCLRLGIFDYYLNPREFGTFGKALYFELNPEPNLEQMGEIVDLFKRTAEMVILTLYDRIIIYFPQVKDDSIFREFIEDILKGYNIQYLVTQISYAQDIKTPKILYHELFDFKDHQWI
jgi:hypothetical protein